MDKKYFRLVGLFGNQRMPLVIRAEVDPESPGMTKSTIDWTPMDHFQDEVGKNIPGVRIIQHYGGKVLAVFTWEQVVEAYRRALAAKFRDSGPQLTQDDGRNVITIEEWRGEWVDLGPLGMPVIQHAPKHPAASPVGGPGSMALAASALRERGNEKH